MKMPLHHISVLVDGAGYSGDQSALDGPKEAGFPQGILASFAWEGWWHHEPDEGSVPR